MIKNNLIRSFAFATLAIVIGSEFGSLKASFDGWNGTVSFLQSETGPFITKSEWKIECNFTNSKGLVSHTSNYRSKWDKDSTLRSCLGKGEGRVEVNIDEVKKTYEIFVSGIPECAGTSLELGETATFTIPGGDSVIVIDRQPLGNDPSRLSGTITLKEGPYNYGKMRTLTYKWNLAKAP